MSTIPYKAADGQTYQLETLAGGDGLNPVRALPPAEATNIALTASQLATVVSSLATIAAALSTSNGHLSSLVTVSDPAVGLTTQITGLGTSAQDGPSLAATTGVWVQNISTGTQMVVVRYKAQGAATLTTGWKLVSAGSEHFFPCTNANELSFIASASGADVGLHAV